jgi:hypothetical protein
MGAGTAAATKGGKAAAKGTQSWRAVKRISKHEGSGEISRRRDGVAVYGQGQLVPPAVAAFLLGLFGLEVYCSLLHGWLLGQRLPFLPLMLTSVYCALGVGWVWATIVGKKHDALAAVREA